jgi:hypothetical protein
MQRRLPRAPGSRPRLPRSPPPCAQDDASQQNVADSSRNKQNDIQRCAGSAKPQRLIAAYGCRDEQATDPIDQRISAIHADQRSKAQWQRQDERRQVRLRTLCQPPRYGKAADDPGIRSTADQPSARPGHAHHHPSAKRPTESHPALRRPPGSRRAMRAERA